MSTQPSSKKQPPSVYTVMLFLSIVFLGIAIAALWIELNRWGPEWWYTDSADPRAMLDAISRHWG